MICFVDKVMEFHTFVKIDTIGLKTIKWEMLIADFCLSFLSNDLTSGAWAVTQDMTVSVDDWRRLFSKFFTKSSD